jgi:hypothetical protein
LQKKRTMKITLEIPNIHASFFMQLLDSLNLGIKVEEKEDIPEWHKAILEERLAQYSNGDKSQFLKWEDIKKGIESEL